MIILYSGTPGSGKSLDMAQRIYYKSRSGHPVIANFPVDLRILEKGRHKPIEYMYMKNDELSPKYLIEYAQEYWRRIGTRPVEDTIILILDEAQLIFNARSWSESGRAEWLQFFTIHRHYGYLVYLTAQFSEMLDKQLRNLIEYEYIHRKVSNFGLAGKLMSLVTAGNLYCRVGVWCPTKTKVESSFFVGKKRFYNLYDTYMDFSQNDDLGDLRQEQPPEDNNELIEALKMLNNEEIENDRQKECRQSDISGNE